MSSILGDPNALGADPGELEALAASMNARADVLDSHRVSLHAQIHQAPWLGLLADAFRREWQTTHYRVMAAAADALRSAANLLLHRAEVQRKASAPDAIPLTTMVGVGLAARVGAATAKAAAASTSPYVAGPQPISNSKIAEAAEAELAQHPAPMATGWNAPGECMVSAQRWVEAAGGRVNRNGEVAGSYGGVATQVPLDQAQRGDIIQYLDPAAPNTDWAHVHTVVVVGTNADGSLRVIERNFDLAGGIRPDNNWRPSPAPGWEARDYRYGSQP
jgi:uncharacterized protein YukE